MKRTIFFCPRKKPLLNRRINRRMRVLEISIGPACRIQIAIIILCKDGGNTPRRPLMFAAVGHFRAARTLLPPQVRV